MRSNNIDTQALSEIMTLAHNFKGTDTLNSCKRQFFDIMRKYNIKKGTVNEDGTLTMNSPEWNACHTIFMESVRYWFCIDDMMMNRFPKDLVKHEAGNE